MARTWVFCLEADFNSGNGNFNPGANPPLDGVFWATGDFAVVGGANTLNNPLFFDADSAPIFYDGAQVFFASRLQHAPPAGPAAAKIQDIVVTIGRLRNGTKPATVGSPFQFGSGNAKPRCVLDSGGALNSITFPA